MSGIYIPTNGPSDWQRFLAQPERQWRTGYSAKTIAHCWEAANGLPPEIGRILCAELGEVTPLIAIPEYETPLPGGKTASQADVFLLARHDTGTVACTIEGKVNEAFGDPVGIWSAAMTPGKRERLAYLSGILGLRDRPSDVHYQLFHRTASAIIEAERYASSIAVMLVHSFSPERRWFEEFVRFAALWDVTPKPDHLYKIETSRAAKCYIGWCCGDLEFLTR